MRLSRGAPLALLLLAGPAAALADAAAVFTSPALPVAGGRLRAIGVAERALELMI